MYENGQNTIKKSSNRVHSSKFKEIIKSFRIIKEYTNQPSFLKYKIYYYNIRWCFKGNRVNEET